MAEQLLTATDSLVPHIGKIVMIDVYKTAYRGLSGESTNVSTSVGTLAGTGDHWSNSEIEGTWIYLADGRTITVDWNNSELDKVEWTVIS